MGITGSQVNFEGAKDSCAIESQRENRFSPRNELIGLENEIRLKSVCSAPTTHLVQADSLSGRKLQQPLNAAVRLCGPSLARAFENQSARCVYPPRHEGKLARTRLDARKQNSALRGVPALLLGNARSITRSERHARDAPINHGCCARHSQGLRLPSSIRYRGMRYSREQLKFAEMRRSKSL